MFLMLETYMLLLHSFYAGLQVGERSHVVTDYGSVLGDGAVVSFSRQRHHTPTHVCGRHQVNLLKEF